jgi:exosortase
MHERTFFHWPLSLSLPQRNGLLVVLLLISIAAFWHPLSALYLLTQEQSHYSHLLLVPLVSAYVFYQRRNVILSSLEWSPPLGFMVVAIGALGSWQALRATSGVDYVSLSTLSFVIVIWGVFLFCYGPGIGRTFSFGLLFLLCMVPFPASVLHTIIGFLQGSAVEGTDLGFSLLGIPVIRHDIVFALPNITIRVDEGCSGIRSTISLIITSIVAGQFFLRSGWAKVGLVIAIVPLAIIDNVFRIMGLSLLANYVNKSFLLDGSLHDLGGHVLFVVSIVVLICLLAVLRRLEQGPACYTPVHAGV